MRYMYKPPSIIDTYGVDSRREKKESMYIDFLLKRLPAIDVDSGEIISNRIKNISINIRKGRIRIGYDDNSFKFLNLTIDKFLENTINAQNDDIPYSIELEYTRDEGFKSFVQEKYPDLAEKLDVQVKSNNKTETYNLFYLYFINNHSDDIRSTCMITDKQLIFQTTKSNIRDNDNIESYEKEHLIMRDKYEEKTETKKQENEHVFIFGSPHVNSSDYGIQFPEKGVSYSQFLFLSDCLNAYEDVKKELDDRRREMLEKKYEDEMKDIKDEIDRSLQLGFTHIDLNKNEVIIGKTHTKEEIKKQINFDAVNRGNIIETIVSYGEDSFFSDIFDEMFPNSNSLKEIRNTMYGINVYGLWGLEANTKAFTNNNGEFDFNGFYKKYMNDAYRKVQERQNEFKSEKHNIEKENLAINMYKRGQELKSHISELEKKIQRIDAEIKTIQRENGILLPSIYQKQNLIQRMKGKIVRFLKRKEADELKGRIGALKTSKNKLESEVNYYNRKYDNMHIQKQYEGMTNEDLDKKSKLLIQDIKERQTKLEKAQDVLKAIEETGVIEKGRDYDRVA